MINYIDLTNILNCKMLSRTQEVDLTFLIFFSYFYFIFLILFLELGLEEQDHAVTQQVTSGDTATSHMMYERIKNILEGIMLYNV